MLPLLVSSLTNIRYLTGVELTFGMVLWTKKSTRLFVDSRYIEKATHTAYKDVTVLPFDDLFKCVKKYSQITFEADDLTVARCNRWKKRFRGTKLIPSEGIIRDIRRIKRDDEIRSIQKACKITDDVLKKIPEMLKGSLTETELAWQIEKHSRERGADAMAFDTIVAFGTHSSRPHHSPTNRKLKKSDIVQIDMGVKVNGYCSDCSRVFFTKTPTDEQALVHNLLIDTVKKCTKMTRTGVTNHQLEKKARTMLGDYEQYFTHALGHGVGLDIHEGASLSSKTPRQALKENEIITIEPGVYIPDKWGMRIEDTILVTKDGSKRMTKCPLNLCKE